MNSAIRPFRGGKRATEVSGLNTVVHDPRKNHLIAKLWPTEHDSWLKHLQAVVMPVGQVLFEAGVELQHLHFPTTAVVSLTTTLQNGASTTSAVVGRDGVVGVSAFMGGESSLTGASVLVAGHGFRIRADILLAEFHRCGIVQHLLLRYTQTLLVQMSQTAVCNQHHTMEQRLSRSLLAKLDRIEGDELIVTQERLALSLGVRREGVTETLSTLARADIVERSRGRVRVIDRATLEQRACECYGVIKAREDALNADHGEDVVCSVRA